MGQICWNFPLLGTANVSGSNNAAIAMFKGSGIMDGLVREICQNSLDAHDDVNHPNDPVIVKFKLAHLEKAKYSMFDGLGKVFDGAENYWSKNRNKTNEIMDFISHAKSCFSKNEIPVLIMSDYNTIGLKGVNRNDDEKSYWDLLANSDGLSGKQDENSGGSFGIGKSAPFAYSGLNTVFYNTYAVDGGRAFQGVCHFVTSQREYNGTMRPTMSSGKYLYLDDEFTGRPISVSDGDPLTAVPEFQRDKYGTDVAVIGFKLDEYPDWENATAVAAIKNFILAIMHNKLIVEIESEKIKHVVSSETLDAFLNRIFKDESQLKYTRQIYQTMTTVEPMKFKVADQDDLSLFIKYDEGFYAAVSRFRSTGMLINTNSESLPHYNIVVVVNDVGECNLSKVLRKSEPPQHTEWKAKNITDNRDLQNKAKRYISKIKKTIQEALDSMDSNEISSSMDGGVGGFLPAENGQLTNEEADGLKADVKINQIVSDDGDVVYQRSYETASSAEGKDTGTKGVKTGKRKRRKRIKTPIIAVNPSSDGGVKGVASGEGKVKVVSLKNIQSRTFYLAANKYRLVAKTDQDLNNVYIQYSAGRDDEDFDSLTVKNVKLDGIPLKQVNGEKIGPISLKAGVNTLHIEFNNKEIMALVPTFTMEVKNNEK